jgi:uncharacterized membrane-anchored protein
VKDVESPLPIRERIRDLNTKAYYLLVALGFIYRRSPGENTLKWAFTLTALVAVLPIQDFLKSRFGLECFRASKVLFLTAALVFTIFWIWTAPGTPN